MTKITCMQGDPIRTLQTTKQKGRNLESTMLNDLIERL